MSERTHSEEELTRVVELLPNPATLARGGQILAVNDAMLAITGALREQVVGQPFLVLLPPEERPRLSERFARHEETPPLDRLSVRVRAAGDRTLLLHIHLRSYPAPGGGAPYVLSSTIDVPEQRSALEMAELLVRVSTGLLAERTVERIRRAALEGFGRGGLWAGFYRAGGSGLAPLEVKAPPPEPLSPALAQEAVRTGRPVFGGAQGEISQVFVATGGERGDEVLVLVGPLSGYLSSALQLFATHLASAYANARLIADLEARNRQTQLLFELAHGLAGTLDTSAILDAATDFVVKLLEASNCFILLYDERERVLRALTASTPVRDDFIGVVRIPIDSQDSLTALTARTRAPHFVEDVERTRTPLVTAHARRYRQRALFAFPLVAHDQLLGVVLVDDTRHPRALTPDERELAQAAVAQIALSVANAKLFGSLKESYAVLAEARAAMVKRERLAALGELSAVVAHEVRNPLGVIFNAVSSLRRLLPGQGDAQMLLEILAEESEQLNRLVGELLEFARPRELSLQLEDVGRVIQDSLEAAASDPLRGQNPVRFVAEVEPDLPPVRMDRRLIRQALVNVAVNAAQAMPRGGTVRVSARKESWLGAFQLRIDLRDEGGGIPPEVAPRIFEPFFTTKAKGTGLGLAVVKRIVEDHQGEVEVTSELGRGTTFTFRLPIADPAAAERPA